MRSADALSCKDDLDTSSNNHASFIVPKSIVINALDLALSQSIAHSTLSDPLSFMSSLPYEMALHCFYAPPFLTGILTMAISTSRVVCMFPPLHAPHYSIPCIFPLLPFKQLSVNLITDLPPSNSHDSVMVIVNHRLMKGVILTPCSKAIDAARIAQVFFNYVFKHFGFHDTLIFDCGPQFASAFARELAHLLKYDV